MKIKVLDLNLRYTSDEYVPLCAVVELENGQRIDLTETENGLRISCEGQTDITLVAANAFIIKNNSK